MTCDRTLKNYLEEKIRGYRMCPGLTLYRVMRRIVWLDDAIALVKDKVDLRKLNEERDELHRKVLDLVRDFPTETTRKVSDREYYN